MAWDAKEGDEEGRKTLGRDMIDLYLKAGATKQVCIGDGRVKVVLQEAEKGVFSREMFENAAQIAESTLSQDIFPRFQESDAGKALAGRRAELCGSSSLESARGGTLLDVVTKAA